MPNPMSTSEIVEKLTTCRDVYAAGLDPDDMEDVLEQAIAALQAQGAEAVEIGFIDEGDDGNGIAELYPNQSLKIGQKVYTAPSALQAQGAETDPVATTDMRMDAYYYGFAPTGVEAIDRILSAVARAGKAFHNTVDWNDECESGLDYLRGDTVVEWIQNAADDAARAYTAPPAQAASEKLKHERKALAEAIGNAAKKSGIALDVELTGPHLLMLADDMASEIVRLRAQAARVPGVDALMREVEKMAEPAINYCSETEVISTAELMGVLSELVAPATPLDGKANG